MMERAKALYFLLNVVGMKAVRWVKKRAPLEDSEQKAMKTPTQISYTVQPSNLYSSALCQSYNVLQCVLFVQSSVHLTVFALVLIFIFFCSWSKISNFIKFLPILLRTYVDDVDARRGTECRMWLEDVKEGQKVPSLYVSYFNIDVKLLSTMIVDNHFIDYAHC